MSTVALLTVGSAIWAASASCATPIVATNTITRGAVNRRVITVNSIAAANTPPAATATIAAEPEVPAVLDHQQRQQRGRQRTHRTHGEVDDPARPVDQDDTEREQADRQAVDEAAVDRLTG